jgi:hypothetical protein
MQNSSRTSEEKEALLEKEQSEEIRMEGYKRGLEGGEQERIGGWRAREDWRVESMSQPQPR